MGGSDEHDDGPGWDEVQARREAQARRAAELTPEERTAARALHYMRCPKCGMELLEITFRGVRVDKCFDCGGVWLDDGELEELAGKPGFFEALRRFFSAG
ncbi:MAG: zf-TFIIB domain-containing protein [Nannocystaceae bacterium]